MTKEVQLYRDNDQITISVGGQQSSMSIGEWSKIITSPKSSNVFAFAKSAEPFVNFDHLPSDCEPA